MSTPATLPDLAERINAEHAACMAAARDAVTRAIEVGRLLAEAKGRVRHGEWAAWVADRCSFGIRQAQSYMRAFHNRDALEEQMRSGDSHLTSLRGAVAMLAEPRGEAEDFAGMTERIRANFGEITRLLDEIRDREGWKAVGYESFEAFVEDRGFADHSPLDDEERAELARHEATIEEGLSRLGGLGITLDDVVEYLDRKGASK